MGRSRERVTLERVKELLHYDPETGVFSRLVGGKGRRQYVCDTPNSEGYTGVYIDGVDYRAHDLAWFYVHGEWPPCKLDHRNGIRSDNKILNLRLATACQNSWNRKIEVDSTSGRKGVYWESQCRKWRARIVVEGRRISLGLFNNLDDAIAARRAAELTHHGEFSR